MDLGNDSEKKYTPVNGQAWSPPPSNDWTHQLNEYWHDV